MKARIKKSRNILMARAHILREWKKEEKKAETAAVHLLRDADES